MMGATGGQNLMTMHVECGMSASQALNHAYVVTWPFGLNASEPRRVAALGTEWLWLRDKI
jgi:hypothetical protein